RSRRRCRSPPFRLRRARTRLHARPHCISEIEPCCCDLSASAHPTQSTRTKEISMRTILFVVAFLFALVPASVRAEPPSIDLRAVVTDGGTVFPARDGAAPHLGPSLLTAPFTITEAHAAGTEVRLTLAPPTAKSFAALTAAHRG